MRVSSSVIGSGCHRVPAAGRARGRGVRAALGLLALFSTTAVAPRHLAAQTPETAGDATAATTKPATPPEGLWPTPKMLHSMLDRWAIFLGEEYELDESQREAVRREVHERWSRFLTEHRPALQPLANEFLEMRMDSAPPSKEAVQAWAKRATPLFDEIRQELSAGNEEFRKVLKPAQRARFEVDAMQFGAGLQFAEQRLKKWESGEYEPEELWRPPGARRDRSADDDDDRGESWRERRQRRREERRKRLAEQKAAEEGAAEAKGLAVAEETDQISREIKTWEQYVEDFARRYNLDDGQRTAALSCISELKERAIAHRDRRKDDITRLEQRIRSNSGSTEELADIRKALMELYGPIDEMFRELQRRMEAIPTAAQRAAASPEATPKRDMASENGS
ncbi:MAG: hypothetical protein HY763_09700 [Planctomycetes bacterium]|nr:hypothetical protein [Planctomycetota bacterium]